MVTNKVLVTVNIPSLEVKYDMFIPVNKSIYNVIGMMKKSLFSLSLGSFDLNRDYLLYNEDTGNVYEMNVLVRDTDIRNNSKIILL